MKRIAPGLGLVAAAAVALASCASRAEDPTPASPPPPAHPRCNGPAPGAAPCAAPATSRPAPCNGSLAIGTEPCQPAPRGQAVHVRLTSRAAPALAPTPVHPVVADLTAALAQTQSKGAFVAAVLALAEMGPDARPAIPAILAHGERLAVFDDAFDGDGHRKGAAGRMVAQALASIAGGSGPGPVAPPPPPSGYAAYPYGPAAPAYDVPPPPLESDRRPAPPPAPGQNPR
jgi:hypothetical protein